MRKIIGIIAIIGGLILGYFGYDKLQDSKAGIKIGELELSATDSRSETNAYLMMGGGAIAVLAGAIILSRSK